MQFQHKTLSEGHWQDFTLFEQLGNVGSEIHRAKAAQGNDKILYESSVSRALELLDLTIADKRWRSRLKEIVRAREFVVDAFFGGKEYGSTFEDLDRYFFGFALAARLNR